MLRLEVGTARRRRVPETIQLNNSSNKLTLASSKRMELSELEWFH